MLPQLIADLLVPQRRLLLGRHVLKPGGPLKSEAQRELVEVRNVLLVHLTLPVLKLRGLNHRKHLLNGAEGDQLDLLEANSTNIMFSTLELKNTKNAKEELKPRETNGSQ